MSVLSTNCLYYAAYRIAHRLSGEAQYARKAEALRQSINQAFWDEDRGTYRYLVDPWGGCDYQESMGLSFAILFGVADARMAESIIEHTVITPNGIPCVYPSFERYLPYGLGRHSGKGTTYDFYDRDWNLLPFTQVKEHNSGKPVPRPVHFDRMIEVAEQLSSGMRMLRVDFYDTPQRLMFGEMTFYDGSGFELYHPGEWDGIIGSWLDLGT